MKVAGWQLALTVAALIAAGSATARAEEATGAAVPEKVLQAKLQYCKTCHGLKGQGFRADSTIPRLAGQQIDYFKNQVQAFVEHRRNNPIMYNVAHVLSPEMLTAIATDFNGLQVKPLLPPAPSAPELISEGKTIFTSGISKGDVPPCASCHGDDAKGNAQFPRLAGQLNDYIFKKLTNWTKERGQDPANPDTSAIMQPIAHALNEAQVKAVAAYLNQLE